MIATGCCGTLSDELKGEVPYHKNYLCSYLTKAHQKLLEALEMCVWWRILKVSLTEKVSSEEVPTKQGAY